MRITKAGLLATAGFLILFAAGIIEAVLDGVGALPALGIAVYIASIAAGVALLFWSLAIKARQDHAAEIATDAAKRRQSRDSVPPPCELCYADVGRVRCAEHDLLICIACCANHDPRLRCTMYLLPRYAEAQKARA